MPKNKSKKRKQPDDSPAAEPDSHKPDNQNGTLPNPDSHKEKGKDASVDPATDSDDGDAEVDSGDLEEDEFVNVDFDFFDPKPIDFHGIKTLLRQTYPDTEDINFSDLADLIISQPTIGSTVKTDSPDPYLLLTVLNVQHHKDNDGMKQLTKYLLGKCSKHTDSAKRLRKLFADSTNPVGVVFNERLINMPPQVVPPLFKMLLEELEWAVADAEPYDFAYYVFVAKTYKETDPVVDDPEASSSTVVSAEKKQKTTRSSSNPAVFYFQPEDEVIAKHALFTVDYRLSEKKDSATADARRTFQEHGIDPARRVMVVRKDKLQSIVSELEKVIK